MSALATTRAETIAALVVLAVLALLPIGRSAELPMLIGAVWGVVLLARGRIDWRTGGPAALTTIVFACYWIPVVLSGFNAVAPEKTWSTAAAILRFLPFALFVGVALRASPWLERSTLAVAAVCALWLVDAWVQYATGYSLAGAPEAERLSGIFGADNLKLGPVLATLSPFVLLAARQLAGRAGLLVAFVVLLVPILLAGSRAGWLSFALVCTVFAWRETGTLRRFAPMLVGIAVAIGGALFAIERDSAALQSRIDRTLLAFGGTEQALDDAAAGRITIWRTSLAMLEAHPWTGVGARGFRHDYPAHAPKGDRFAPAGATEGASHPHQIVLEVLVETGWLGFLFWIAGGWITVRAWWRASTWQRQRAFAPALALLAMCFPLNTHFAFYSTWWGLLFWWLLSLYFAAICDARDDHPRSALPA